MESAAYPDQDAQARQARAAALALRPPAAPVPDAGVRPTDPAPYWLAAHQYFAAAQQHYQGGDHARGDYCIVRGDAYMQLASLCTMANSSGVAPLRAVAPPNPDTAAPPPGYADVAALRARLRRLRELHPIKLPTVPAEAANTDPCLDFFFDALTYGDKSAAAFNGGDSVAGYYYADLADQQALLFDICEQIVHPSASGSV
jgi:hypothetical protein